MNAALDLTPKPSSRTLSLATGLDYHVLEWGAESSAEHTLLLVHGLLDLSWGWQPLLASWQTLRPDLLDRFHIVAPDMRGHGRSDRVGAGGYYYFLDYLADLHELVAALARERLSLIGHSMGGSVCAYYAGTFPERVSRLALLEGIGAPEQAVDMPKQIAAWLASCKRVREREDRSYDSVEAAAQRLRKFDPRLDEELALFLARRGTRTDSDGRVRFLHDPLHATRGPYPYLLELAESFWRNIPCPVLLLEGGESHYPRVLGDVQRRHRAFANARHQLIDGAGHMMQRHQPMAIARILDEFLD